MATLVTINEAELAFQMTANIFNPCIVNGMYGQWWWDDKITARLDMPKKVPWEEVIRGNHHPEQKRAVADDPDMLCYKPWTPFERPPNITDCREAMDVLSRTYHSRVSAAMAGALTSTQNPVALGTSNYRRVGAWWAWPTTAALTFATHGTSRSNSTSYQGQPWRSY